MAARRRKAAAPADPRPQIRAYIAKLAPSSRKALRALRAVIRAAAPTASEGFSYGIPGFRVNGRPLVWYAGWKDRVSMYPVTAAMKRAGGKDIRRYQAGKGTLRFPLDAPLPAPLIRRLVRARVAEADA